MTLVTAGTLLILPSASAAKVFPNCKAVDKVYPHGIAKNFKVIKDGEWSYWATLRERQLYAVNHTRDRDKDGVACET